MTQPNKNTLDQAISDIHEEKVSQKTLDMAANRSWQKIQQVLPNQEPIPMVPQKRSRMGLGLAIAAVLLCGLFISQWKNIASYTTEAGPPIILNSGQVQMENQPLEMNKRYFSRGVFTTGNQLANLNIAGSSVEIKPHSRFKLALDEDGVSLNLERGAVFANRDGLIHVQTPDMKVVPERNDSFNRKNEYIISHGIRGSHVSMLSGSLKLEQDGQQIALAKQKSYGSRSKAITDLQAEQVKWSRAAKMNNTRHLFAQQEGLRYESQTLGILPADTETLISLDRDQTTPEMVLKLLGRTGFGAFSNESISLATQHFTQLSPALDTEIAIGLMPKDLGSYYFVAKVANQEILEQQLNSLIDESDIVRFDDVHDHGTWQIQQQQGWVILASHRDIIRHFNQAQADPEQQLLGTPFYGEVQYAFAQGLHALAAVNLGQFLDSEHIPENGFNLKQFKHLVLRFEMVNGQLTEEGSLSFDSAQTGLASWIAKPAPLGSVEFFSGETSIMVTAALEDPVAMLDDLTEAKDDQLGEYLEQFKDKFGIDSREEITGSFGGEFSFGIDGQLLPSPEWKIIASVNTPEVLQDALATYLSESETGYIEQTNENYTLYNPSGEVAFHYTYLEGYLVVTPTAQLLEKARLTFYSDVNLPRNQSFLALLPQDGRSDFSALYYQNFSSVTGWMNVMPTTTQQPLLAYAYAERDRIIMSSNGTDSSSSFDLMKAVFKD